MYGSNELSDFDDSIANCFFVSILLLAKLFFI